MHYFKCRIGNFWIAREQFVIFCYIFGFVYDLSVQIFFSLFNFLNVCITLNNTLLTLNNVFFNFFFYYSVFCKGFLFLFFFNLNLAFNIERLNVLNYLVGIFNTFIKRFQMIRCNTKFIQHFAAGFKRNLFTRQRFKSFQTLLFFNACRAIFKLAFCFRFFQRRARTFTCNGFNTTQMLINNAL